MFHGAGNKARLLSEPNVYQPNRALSTTMCSLDTSVAIVYLSRCMKAKSKTVPLHIRVPAELATRLRRTVAKADASAKSSGARVTKTSALIAGIELWLATQGAT